MALRVLQRVELEGAFSNLALRAALSRWPLPEGERDLATELVLGVLRWRARLDWTLQAKSGRQLLALPPAIRQILRLGAYQLLFLQRVAHAVAVSSSVELAKRYGHAGTAAFTNAVLRRVAREGEAPPPETPDERLSVLGSHPLWLVRRWLERWPSQEVEKLCEVNNTAPPAHLRVNTLKAAPQEVAWRLTEAGLEVRPGSLPESLHVRGPLPARLALAEEGSVVAQDEAALVVAYAVDPRPGELVVDACAAPGGKATHLAALMGNQGRVVACDVHPRKVEALARRAQALGATSVEARRCDARALDVRGADRVLVDAPCTGLGVLRRRPEIRWRVVPEDLPRAAEVQRAILKGASDAVRSGGVLVYSVCSTEPEEGEAVVEWLLASGGFVPDPFAVPWGDGSLRAEGGTLRLWPHHHGTDGYFIARFRRT
ncbi:MAG: 16S rRNA (cytosine(967)-C(5))-methyltransferase RsmB [Armatimonadota bacterium]|nr:16S rRNA (cytosine(967)-C(5))-methyltransferase RsmB [Armatimonadota bacterium]MDR5689514.1 16S rRNA (cytosine(967)-C(5))-methyltransferase RsmB [Armatimonadota bacterium]